MTVTIPITAAMRRLAAAVMTGQTIHLHDGGPVQPLCGHHAAVLRAMPRLEADVRTQIAAEFARQCPDCIQAQEDQ